MQNFFLMLIISSSTASAENLPVVNFSSVHDPAITTIGPANFHAFQVGMAPDNTDYICATYSGYLRGELPVEMHIVNSDISAPLLPGESNNSGCTNVTQYPDMQKISVYFVKDAQFDSDYGLNYSFTLKRK